MKISFILFALCFAVMGIAHADEDKVMLVITDQQTGSGDVMNNPLYQGDLQNPLYEHYSNQIPIVQW